MSETDEAGIQPYERSVFNDIRCTAEDGTEFWTARLLAKLLGYSEYRNFLLVIEKAKGACRNSGHDPADHFEDILEMVPIGSGATRRMPSLALSRYACYLIVQNADPAKPIVAEGQTYFAIQTRRQELADEGRDFDKLEEDEKRLLLREELKKHNRQIVDAAKGAGVETTIDFYRAHGKRIFRRRWCSRFDPLKIFASRYSGTRLRALLEDVFGPRTLGDIPVPLILPAVDIGNG